MAITDMENLGLVGTIIVVSSAGIAFGLMFLVSEKLRKIEQSGDPFDIKARFNEIISLYVAVPFCAPTGLLVGYLFFTPPEANLNYGFIYTAILTGCAFLLDPRKLFPPHA